VPASPTRPAPAYLAIAAAAVCVFMNLYSPQAVLPLLAQEFGASPSAVSLTMTANTLAVAAVAPFAGALADVLGRKRIIVSSMLAVAAPTLLMGFAPDLSSLIAIRFVQGLLLPPIFAVLVAYIGEEWPRSEATGMTGVYIAAGSFGGFLGRFLTGVVADFSTWRTAFLVDGLITLTLAFAVLALLPRERHFVRAAHIGAALAQMLRHFANPQLTSTFALGFGVLFNFLAAFTYVTFYLAEPPFSLSPALLGSVFIVYLCGTAASPWTGRAVARFGRKPVVLALLSLWAAGAVITLTASLPAIVFGMALFAIGGFLCQAASTSYVALSAREGASSAVGLYVTCYYVGGSLGAVAGGIAWHIGKWPAVIGLVLAMLGAMAAIVTVAWPRNA
jgi:predicted MFS family arabinose efflux permease